MVLVHVPIHSSSLKRISFPRNSLVIRCHTERGAWSTLLPLLAPQIHNCNSSDKYLPTIIKDSNAIKMLFVIIRYFTKLKRDAIYHNKGKKRPSCYFQDAIGLTSTMKQNDLTYTSKIKIPINFLHIWNKEIVRQSDMKIFILPLFPSPYGKLEAERIWSAALIGIENLRIRLISLNAYIATLGGGYFLCRKLETARILARQQRMVACALGDFTLAGQCTVNEAYNYIFAGKISEALAMINSVSNDAKIRNDMLLLAVCRAARLFAKRVRKARKYYTNSQGRIPQQKQSVDKLASTVDDFQRIRIRQC